MHLFNLTIKIDHKKYLALAPLAKSAQDVSLIALSAGSNTPAEST
jgi:hypothetical protein